MSHRDRLSAYWLGRFAEYAVIVWLSLKGYRVLGQRLKTPHGEIDILCATRETLVIVEVKARKHLDDAAASLSAHQQKRLRNAASYLVSRYPRYASRAIRFDCCLVTWYMRVRHIQHAFM